ncbi:hypothetical protein B0O99DRAFT_630204 [Bisporella sp. PMI_857]|nr:hypothetical protein B0O99DRAFT_630204 [Bisporella sp. PMI_857]
MYFVFSRTTLLALFAILICVLSSPLNLPARQEFGLPTDPAINGCFWSGHCNAARFLWIACVNHTNGHDPVIEYPFRHCLCTSTILITANRTYPANLVECAKCIDKEGTKVAEPLKSITKGYCRGEKGLYNFTQEAWELGEKVEFPIALPFARWAGGELNDLPWPPGYEIP